MIQYEVANLPTCPLCHAPRLCRSRTFLSQVMLPLYPLVVRLRCRNCGHLFFRRGILLFGGVPEWLD